MKTVNILFEKYYRTYKPSDNSPLIEFSNFKKALVEHNQEILKVIDNMKTNINKDFDADDPTGNLIIQSNLHILELLKIAIEME